MSEILVDRQYAKCTILSLNRPSKRNALTIALMEELTRHIEETSHLKGQRAIILKGEGSAFCAGLDLEEAADSSLEERSSHALNKLLRTLNTSPLVTIAAVHGAALAGGGGLMCACDLAIAESGTQFAFPETRRGLVAAQIMPYVRQWISRRHLYEMMLLGESIDAQRAYEIGLINKVAPVSNVLAEALLYVQSLIKGAPQETLKAKKYMKQVDGMSFESGIELGLQLHRELRQGKEFKEGIEAFLEKRPPNWNP